MNSQIHLMCHSCGAAVPVSLPDEPRKVVQAAIGATEEGDTAIALCNDGSLWSTYLSSIGGMSSPKWVRLPPIPQMDAEELSHE